MLSVVIPMYNVGPYLDKCIESVVKQTYKDMEILLINDGSTDKTPEICKKWANIDKRIIYINKQNEGAAKTRNLGIKRAIGEYITFLDADDWWREDYAEFMLEYMEDCDIAICDINYIDYDKDGNMTNYISKIRIPDRTVMKVAEDGDSINKARTFLWGKVFRRELFIKNNIEIPAMVIEDIPIVTLLVAKAEYICRVGEPLYNYLRNREGNTVTSPKVLKSFGDALVAMRENFDKHNLTKEYEKALRKMYYSQYRYAMRKAINHIKDGNISAQEYKEVKVYLETILYDFWKDCPQVDKMYFLKSENEDINRAIGLFILDDERLVEEVRENTYVVQYEEENKLIYGNIKKVCINKKQDLTGEDLWWDIADQILFSL